MCIGKALVTGTGAAAISGKSNFLRVGIATYMNERVLKWDFSILIIQNGHFDRIKK